MITTKKENMITTIHPQMIMNKRIAKAIGSDEGTAFMYGSQVKRRLTVPITDNLFISLVNLCHKVGIENFGNSIVLKMVNADASKRDIKNMVRMTLSYVN